MKLQKFIDCPILSMVISVVILVAGLIGLYALSVEQYPDIAPPTIRVSTTYSGANAEAVQKSVIVPLEEAINGVENMTYMTSTASNTGSAEITVYFKQGTDPRHGCRQRAEQGVYGNVAASGRSDKGGCYHDEEAEQHAYDIRSLQS